MNKIILLYSFLLVLLNTFVSEVSAQELGHIEPKTYEALILWVGCGCPGSLESFDPNCIKTLSCHRQKSFEIGLEIFERKAQAGNALSQETLANYYFRYRELKKGLYWAMKSAEQGSDEGMFVLATAYLKGEGVVQDFVEGVKWTFLAAAAGKESALEGLKAFDKEIGESSELMQKGKTRAQAWVREHPKAFFCPD